MEHHIRFDADAMTLYLLDQRALPGREDYLPIRTLDETIRALQVMALRNCAAACLPVPTGVRPMTRPWCVWRRPGPRP